VLRFFNSERRIQAWIVVAIIVVFLATIFELVFGGVAESFSRSGVRTAGPFINPNNTGIVLVVLAVIYHYYSGAKLSNFLVGGLAAISIVVTGSKTAMAIYAFSAFILLPNRWRTFLLLFLPIGLILSTNKIADAWSYFDLRDFNMESGEIRSANLSIVLDFLGEASAAKMLFGISNKSLLDNAFLDIACFGGFSLLLSFFIIEVASISICIRRKLKLAGLLHGVFFLAMLTTDLPRLWPTGYMYWCLVGITTLKGVGAAKDSL
jgi:hypothetical protein